MPITLKEAVSQMESHDWISLRFITADVNKGTGGKVIVLQKCRIAKKQSSELLAGTKQETKTMSVLSEGKKNPNHAYNFTRNMEMPNYEIRKVHPLLVTHVNNIPVV